MRYQSCGTCKWWKTFDEDTLGSYTYPASKLPASINPNARNLMCHNEGTSCAVHELQVV